MQHIISDCHGCAHTLDKLIRRVYHFDQKAQFIFIGDYADRGLYSKDVVNIAIEMKKSGAICLLGNHDNVINWLLNGMNEGNWTDMAPSYNPIEVVMWWMVNGFDATLKSYDIIADGMDYADVCREFQDKVSEEHKIFYSGLKMFWECDSHFACHAHMAPNEKLSYDECDKSQANDMLWSRFDNMYQRQFIPVTTVWDKIGVFGHTPVQNYGAQAPIKYDKIRLIDTGAAKGHYLCAYCCQIDDHILQAVDDRDIKQ